MATGEAESPRWAVGLDAGDVRRVRNLVAQELRTYGLAFRFVEEGVACAASGGEERVLSLGRLAERCAASEPSQWSDVVRREVARLVGAAALRAPSDAPPTADAPRSGSSAEPSGAPPGAGAAAPAEEKPTLGDEDWKEAEETEPPSHPPPAAPRRLALSTLFGWVMVLALLVTVGLELVAYVRGQSSSRLRAGPSNEVLLEAAPANEVVVVSEADGTFLGRAPLRLLVPEGPEVAVLLAAPERTPKRVVLPSSGRVTVRLDPRLPTAPRCRLRLPHGWAYEDVLEPSEEDDRDVLSGGDAPRASAALDTHLPIHGSAVVRIRPAGYGAWLVTCPPDGAPPRIDVTRKLPTVAEVHVREPIGGLALLAGRPIGTIPVRWTQGRAFVRLAVRSLDGVPLARWVATPGPIDVDLPISGYREPPLTIPGTRVERDPSPLRPVQRRRRPASAGADLEAPILPLTTPQDVGSTEATTGRSPR